MICFPTYLAYAVSNANSVLLARPPTIEWSFYTLKLHRPKPKAETQVSCQTLVQCREFCSLTSGLFDSLKYKFQDIMNCLIGKSILSRSQIQNSEPRNLDGEWPESLVIWTLQVVGSDVKPPLAFVREGQPYIYICNPDNKFAMKSPRAVLPGNVQGCTERYVQWREPA